MLSARDFFEIDKPRGKLICKVVISGDKSNGTARYCNAELSNNNNTSSMNGHLKSRHKSIKFKTKNSEPENPNAPSVIKQALLNTNTYDKDSEKYRQITERLVEFIVVTNQPLSIVDEKPFIKFLSLLDNKYKIPGRQTLSDKYLKESCEKIKKIIHKNLENVEFVSVTLDGWSSVTNQSYLGMFY